MVWLNLLSRWLHVASAVVGLGGLLLMRVAVLPALARLPNGEEAYEAIRLPFKRVFHGAMGLLLLTGGWNYYVAIEKIHALKEQDPSAMASYHPVMGTKILLALVLFVLAILLLKPVPSFNENRKTWFSVGSALGLLILLLAAYLRRMWLQ